MLYLCTFQNLACISKSHIFFLPFKRTHLYLFLINCGVFTFMLFIIKRANILPCFKQWLVCRLALDIQIYISLCLFHYITVDVLLAFNVMRLLITLNFLNAFMNLIKLQLFFNNIGLLFKNTLGFFAWSFDF
jgi:hypothetical protein